MIQQLPATGISTFTLESTYVDISCTNRTHIDVNYPSLETMKESYIPFFNSKLQFHNANSPFTAPVRGRRNNETSSLFINSSSLAFSRESIPVDHVNTTVILLYASSSLSLHHGATLSR